MKLIAIKGVPGSGKSTWVTEQIKESGVVRVESDLIRRMLHGEQWLEEYEDAVYKLRKACIRTLLDTCSSSVHTVIDDECSHGPQLEDLEFLALFYGAEFEIKSFLDVPIEECIRRDALRPEGKRVGEGVIRKIAAGYGL